MPHGRFKSVRSRLLENRCSSVIGIPTANLSKAPKRQLHAEGRLEEFVLNATENRNQVQELQFRRSNDLPSSDETDDSDYEPHVEKQTLKEIKHDKG